MEALGQVGPRGLENNLGTKLSASRGGLAHRVNQSPRRAEHSVKDIGEGTIN